MRIFLDTANVDEIRKGYASGCVSGVTTNPTIISREGKSFDECIKDIVSIDNETTLLMEVVAKDTQGMISEALKLAKLVKNAVVKIPMTPEGLAAVKELSARDISTCVTMVFSINQAIAASCAGAGYVAPFVGRLDDINSNGLELVKNIKKTFDIQKVETRIIAASLRTAQTVSDLFANGCDIVTMPGKILDSMLRHSLTEAGLAKFDEDWKRVPVLNKLEEC